MGVSIHSLSVVAPGAELGENVEIGPFCVVGAQARLGDGVRLLSHVSVTGATTIGPRTVIHPFAALGHPPQDLGFRGEDTRLVLGSDNVLREHVTMNLGTPGGRRETRIGDRGFFMAGAHVGHDCIVGDGVVFANNATLGGFVVVEDFVIMGGLSAVHQLGRVGKYAFVGGGAPLVGDVIPFGMVDNHGHLHGLNLVGLKRRGFRREVINELRAVYRDLFHGAGQFDDRLTETAERYAALPEAMMIVDFIRAGQKRPLCMPRRG
ncbi:MAG: acyl-ACP--UDP-N-acetylglucosamine O-acyltransferase [Alphaproteobacteria bacterium]|nr:acyl-ACP--UDP-N-acetylglucosamine O-acyltransferase [Alphaproteobacteria bacterium]